jgi:predicted DsbA family dithiol-disulfide isomerase
MSSPILISVWSDYVCPFCYLEVPVLDQLQAEFGTGVEVQWRAFELRPEPVPTLAPDGEYLHSTWARAVYPMAAARGMTLHLPPVQPRSRLAMEAVRFAFESQGPARGLQMHLAVFKAFFEQGQDIGDIQVLLALAGQASLNVAGLQAALKNGDYRAAVQADQQQAAAWGVRGVPALLIQRTGPDADGALLLSGAQPLQTVRQAVQQVMNAAP